LKIETSYMGVKIVHEEHRKIDQARSFLIHCIMLYAELKNRHLKIIFFNGADEEQSISFFFERENHERDVV
jgi:hypothetical protein